MEQDTGQKELEIPSGVVRYVVRQQQKAETKRPREPTHDVVGKALNPGFVSQPMFLQPPETQAI